MITVSKTNPACNSADDIVYIGNVKLIPYDEPNKPKYNPHPANFFLQFDVLSDEAHKNDLFTNVRVELEMVQPAAARFVHYTGGDNYPWKIFSAGNWLDAPAVVATSQLLIHVSGNIYLLHGGGTTGKTFRVGISSPVNNIQFKAVVTADRITEGAPGCQLLIGLDAGDSSKPYLP